MLEIMYNAAAIALALLALIGLITTAFFVMELAKYIKDKHRRKREKPRAEVSELKSMN